MWLVVLLAINFTCKYDKASYIPISRGENFILALYEVLTIQLLTENMKKFIR